MKKAAMIGLDGMPWHILDRLFKWNVMPNLKAIANQSLRGTLKSTIPPSSAPAWTSIATGVNPGKHGIFAFTKHVENYKTEIVSSRDVKYLRIHEMVAVQGLRSVCVNQILTYPMKKIPGTFLITDWLSPKIEYSPKIARFARNYRGPTLKKVSPKAHKDWRNEYADVSSRVNTVNALLQEVDWDLFWVVYSEPDHLFHRYYDLVMKKDKNIIRLFSKIDETFGIVKDICDLLIIVSDHGFNKYSYGVYVNTYLEDLGLVKKAKKQVLKDLVGHREIDKQKTRRFHIPEKWYKYVTGLPPFIEFVMLEVYRRLAKSGIKARLTTYVDPRSSKAFAEGFGLYVKEVGLIDDVISMLKKTTFIGGVWKKEELYSGKMLERMPDLIILPNYNESFAFRSNVIAPKPVVRRDFAGHHPDGIVIIHEESVQPSWLEGIKVYDIAPTILDFLGLDIPEDTDGRVIDLSP